MSGHESEAVAGAAPDTGAIATASGDAAPTRRRSPFRLLQVPMIIWLTLVWTALWGDPTPLVLVSGVVVGLGVCLVLPLPPLRADITVRPVALARLLLRFVWDVLRASLEVTWVTLRPRAVRNAVIEVDLASNSDLAMTVVGEIVSLVPGSVIVEARRSTHTLFLHVIDVEDDTDVEAARQRVLAQEQRVLAAFSPQWEPARDPGARRRSPESSTGGDS